MAIISGLPERGNRYIPSEATQDINGDGFDDLIIGACHASNNYSYSGSSYVVFGQGSFPPAIPFYTLNGTNGFRLDGANPTDYSGRSVSIAGDVNGDGFADLVVGGSPGSVVVVFGQPTGFVPAMALGVWDGMSGFALNGVTSYAVNLAGDVNGDGLDDLIIGDPTYGSGGAAYVVFGNQSMAGSVLDLAIMSTSQGFRLDGAASSMAGFSVSGAGDVNGDGLDDLVIGAYGANGGAGASYVVFGQTAGFSSVISLGSLNGSDGFRLDGTNSWDYSGFSVSSAGDYNGDGFDDLIIGVPRAAVSSFGHAGSSYVVFGGSSFSSAIQLSSLSGSSGFRLDDVVANGKFGYSVSAAGDVNGDGFDDLLIGAPSPSGYGSGVVIFGSALSATNVFLGTAGADSLTGTAAAEQFTAGSGNDTIDSGGGADVVHAGAGDDTIIVSDLTFRLVDGGNGSDTLSLAGSGVTLDLAALRGRLEGMESVDLTGSGNNTLVLTALDVLNLSDSSNVLKVDGDAGDTVQAGAGWTDGGISGGYHTYVQGQAILQVAATVTVVAPPPASASVIGLSSLDGNTGFRLDGVAAGDQLGWSVSSAGDVNGDGFDDLIVGARYADANALSNAGSNYIVFGGAFTPNSVINLSTLNGSTGFRLDGESASSITGWSVSSAGDVNGDGLDDIVVGAYRASPNGVHYAGSSYVIFGRTSGFQSAINLSTLDGNIGFRVDGETSFDRLGHSVSSAGDINGDGFDDLLFGDHWDGPDGRLYAGSVYVMFGKESGFQSAIYRSSLSGTTGFRLVGVNVRDHTGTSALSAGDVNGDGYDDLIVGGWNEFSYSTAGSTYVVFGQSSGLNTTINLSTLNGSNGFRLDGVAASDLSDWSVHSAGDMNGDGLDDIVIGSRNSLAGAGSSYVMFGQQTGFSSVIQLSSLSGSVGFRLDGVAASDLSGRSVSSAGDFNGDGFDDLLVGASGAGGGAGASYVIFGKSALFGSVVNLSSLDGSTGFCLNGAAAGNALGVSVSAAGDINGDGFSDLIIGANTADPNGLTDAGSSFVLFGSNSTNAVTFLGTNGADTLNAGTSAAESFVAGQGNDTMTGGGGADVFHGGEGNDIVTVSDLTFQLVDGGTGTDTLALSGSGITLTLSALRGRIEEIEVIDLTGSGDNTLVLTVLDVLNLSGSSNTLKVDGDAGDAVIIGSGWADGGTSGGYRTYTQGQAILQLNTAMTLPLPSVVPLAVLNGSSGFRLDGLAAGDNLGFSVHSAGDINGDGFDDLAVSAVHANPNGLTSAGSGYVIFGKSVGFASTFDLATLDGSNGFRLDGAAANDWAGHSIHSAGDINGDGFDDLILGAPYADPNGITDSGSSYVLFGKATGFASAITLSALNGTNGFRLDGTGTGDNSGKSVSSVGDMNGDGLDDLIINATLADPNGQNNAGSVYVVFGQVSGFPSALQLSSLNGSTGFRLDGMTADGNAGCEVSGAGDVNGDGLDDLVIKASSTSTIAGYVVFGSTSGFSSTMQLSSLDGSNGFRLDSIADDFSGFSVSSAGDVNGDGVDDLVFGGIFASPNGQAGAGSSYVVFGQTTAFSSVINLSILDGATGFRLNGVAAGYNTGNAVSSAGDVNGDGFDDLIIGGQGTDPNGMTDAGSGYVIFGKASGFASVIDLSVLDSNTGFRLDGLFANALTGFAVSAAGDINGDGYGDLIIGAHLADPNGVDSGSAYILFGSNFNGFVTFLGTSGADTLGAGTSAAERFVSGGGDDVLTGGGGADVFHGGEGNDTIIVSDLTFQLVDGGTGTDTLALSGSGITLTLSALRGRIEEIEVIDLTGSGDNTLILTALDLLNLSSSSNTLTVEGDAGDVVDAGVGWMETGGAGGYRVFTQGQAVLQLATAVSWLPQSVIQLSSLNGGSGFRLGGLVAGDMLGSSVSSAGDINGDGFDDLIVGARMADPSGTNSGSSYVIFGKSAGFRSLAKIS